MGIQDILSISGKSGLHKLVGQMKNGVIVESLVDGRKTPAHAHNRISALADISIYGEDGEKPLEEILKAMLIKSEGEPVQFKKWNGEQLKSEFLEIFPDYDDERVYVSDIKKVYQWANLLLDKGYISLEWANKAPEEKEVSAEESEEESV